MEENIVTMSSSAPRRTIQAVAIAALVSIIAATTGCGSDEPTSAGTATSAAGQTSGSSAPASTEDAAATTTAATFPVTVQHALGETTIVTEPTRVVSVGLTEQDTLLALGVVPVGVTEWYGDQPFATWPWAQDELGGAEPEVLSAADDLQYERIAALEPDLIVGTNAGLDETSYRLLSDIAPTIAHPDGAPMYFSPWADQARLIGEALGRSEQIELLIEDVDAQFAEAAAAHPEFADRAAVLLQNAFYDGQAIAYQDGLSTAFLTDLGFTIPTVLDGFESEGGQAYIPIESLNVLDEADVLIWATEAPADRTALEAEPLYLALEEVRQGRQVFTDGLTAGAIYFTSVLSLPYVLDRLVPALASTLAGEGPATVGASS